MGIVIFIAFVLVIGILGYLLVYSSFYKFKPAPPPFAVPGTCNQNCDQGRNCDCFQKSCDMTVKEYSELNVKPQATWPFPATKP